MGSKDRHISILIAEDDAMFADALVNMVRNRFSCDIRLVTDGDAALEALDAEQFDLFVTDMQMPGVHGRELVEQVKKKRPDLDIIAMTAFSTTYPYVEIVRAGASDFLSKPFHLEEMEAKLVRVLEERDQRNALLRDRERILAMLKGRSDGEANGAGADAKYRAMFELSMMPTVVLEPNELTIRDANRAFCEIVASDGPDLLGKALDGFLDDASMARLKQVLAMLEETGRGTLSDMTLRPASGGRVAVDLSITYIGDDDERFIHVACKDVSEQRVLQEQLAEMAATDELTGLFNQRALRLRLEAAIQGAKTAGRALSLVSIDLDNFKQCNDTHGHPAGDQVLQLAGRIIREQIRSHDSGFRNGGDEFCVLLDSAGAEIARRVGERIQAAFQGSECFGTSMSIGVAEFLPGMDAARFLRASDEALYRAKSSGKNTICVA